MSDFKATAAIANEYSFKGELRADIKNKLAVTSGKREGGRGMILGE